MSRNDIKQDESAFDLRARLTDAPRAASAARPLNGHETAMEMHARLTTGHVPAAAPTQQRRRQAQHELPPARRGFQQPHREPPHREPAHRETPRVAERAPALKPDEDALAMRSRVAAEPAANRPIKADESAFDMATRLQGASSGVAVADTGYTVVDLSVGARRTPTTPTMS